MSVTFRPCVDESGKPLIRCTCSLPEDSRAYDESCPACLLCLNLSNVNARDLLADLQLPGNLRSGYGSHPSDCFIGSCKASDLVAACNRRLWPEKRASDAPIEPQTLGRLYLGGRSSGYIREKTEMLLKIATAANDFWVCWS